MPSVLLRTAHASPAEGLSFDLLRQPAESQFGRRFAKGVGQNKIINMKLQIIERESVAAADAALRQCYREVAFAVSMEHDPARLVQLKEHSHRLWDAIDMVSHLPQTLRMD